MPVEELIRRLRSIYVWSATNPVVRQKTAELIQMLGGTVP